MSDLTERLRERFEGEAFDFNLHPTIRKLLALVAAAERCQNLIVEDTCEECETFKEVRYSIKPLKDALQALRAEVGE